MRFSLTTAVILLFFALREIPLAQETGNGETETPPKERSIFSYEVPVQKKPEEKRWFLTLSGWYEHKTGNTETLKTNGQADIVFDDNISEFRLGGRIFYGGNAGQVNEHKAMGVVKYDHYIMPRFELFAFSQSEYNIPAKLSYRVNSGAGAKIELFRNAFWKMDISGAPIYQNEDYKTIRSGHEFRWSLRYRLRITPVEPVVFSFMTFFIPRMVDWADYRFVMDSFLTVSVTRIIALKAGFLRHYNRTALPGTRRLDDTAYAQVSISL